MDEFNRCSGLPERGLPDFDYATYVREGIKNEWVRKDDKTLYKFFGVPWKVQRKECVPELVRLLEHPEKKVRWWAVVCLCAHRREQGYSPGAKLLSVRRGTSGGVAQLVEGKGGRLYGETHDAHSHEVKTRQPAK